MTMARARTRRRRALTSDAVPPSITRFTPRKNAPFGFSAFASRSAASAGVSVSAQNAEMAIDTAIVSANC